MVTFAQYFHGVQLREDSELSSLPIESQTSIIGLIGVSKIGPSGTLVLIDSPKKALETFGSNADVDALIKGISDRKVAVIARIDSIDKRVSVIDTDTLAIDTRITSLTTDLNAADDAAKPPIQKQIDDLTKKKTDAAAEKASLTTEKTSLVLERDGKKGANPVKSLDTKIQELEDQKKVSTLPDAFTAIYSQSTPLIVALNIYDASKTTIDDYKTVAASSEGAGGGIFKFLEASDVFGFAPKILVAPFLSDDSSVRTSLQTVAEKLRAVAFIDIASTKTVDEAIAEVRDLTSSRLQPCFPLVTSTLTLSALPMSLFAAGHTAAIDRDQGYWVSPSNKVMKSITGISKTVRFSLDDEKSEVNRLNEAGISTIVRVRGFRYFGARTVGKTNKVDEANRFLNVRRTSDVLNETLVTLAFEAVDQNIGKNFLSAVVEDMNKYLSEKKRQGAIVGGSCSAPIEDNPIANLSRGIVVFRVDYTPSFPAEQIRIISTITDKYLAGIFAN